MNRTIIMIQQWDKVKTLISEKPTVAQISRIVGIDRKPVRRYRDMSQEQISALMDREVGRYRLTAALEKYVLEVGYKPVFAMARDPQSKGLVKVYVRYVKHGFLRGRIYVDDESLNDEAAGWFERTGNRNRHSVYRFIPFKESLKNHSLQLLDFQEVRNSERLFFIFLHRPYR